MNDQKRMELFREARKQGVPFRQVRVLMRHLTGKESTKDLTEQEFNAVLCAVSFDAEPFDGPVAA